MSTLLASFLRRLGAAALLAIVAGCGGGGGGGAAPPVVPPAAVVIGSAGGVVHGPDGVSVTIPAGALAADTTLQIVATTAAAALPLPAGVTAGPRMYSLLPHGTRFSVPVTLTVRRDAADPADVSILKTNSEGTAWEQLVTDSVGANYSALIVGFSSMTWMCNCAAPPPPVISMQPASGSVNEGGLVFLSVSAIGAQPFTYTWISSRLGRLGPQASPAIVVNPVTLADDGLQLRVEVKDRFGQSTISGPGIVFVIPAAPVVASEPIDVSAVAGTTALFSALTRSSVAQQINWQRFDPTLPGGGWGASLSSTNQLSLPNISRAIDDQALFRMTAQNVSGGPVVFTRSARLTVLAAEAAPAIQSQPQDVATVAGRSAVFGVVASGGGLDFDWRRSDDQGASWSGRLPGSGSAQFVISNVTSTDDGALFRVVVQNTVAPAAQSATARLVVAPSVGSAPVRVGGGGGHSMALRADATLVAWGDNGLGQLGRGSFGGDGAPQNVSGLSRVATFSVGGSHTLAIDDLGAVSAWGATSNGVLGDPAVRDGSRPVSPIGIVGPARFVAAGVSTSLAVTGSDFYSWGSGYHGDGRRATRDTATPTGFGFVAATAGRGNFTLALSGDGTVWAWGSNAAGQLGTGDRGARVAPEAVTGLPRSVAVSAGANHSLALGENGVVWAWGNNFFGQLGLGDGIDRTRPVAVVLPGIAIAIAAGDLHSLALLADGRVFAWGFNTEGQIGRGDSLDSPSPVNVVGGWSGRIIGIGAGNRHSLAVDAAGAVWAWGLNDTMQLGDGTRTARNRPVQTQGVNLNLSATRSSRRSPPPASEDRS